MTALATVADLELRLRTEPGSLTGADLAAATVALEDASTLVAAAAASAGLEEPWTAASVPPAARRVVLGVALRTYRNPEGYVSEAMGGGAYSYRYADDETSAYLTATEAQIVGEAVTAGGTTRAGFTGSLRTPLPWEASGSAATPWWL